MSPSATLMMRAAPDTMSELVRASLSTRTGGVGATTPRVRRMRSSARCGSVSCWSASSFCTSGALRAASGLTSAAATAPPGTKRTSTITLPRPRRLATAVSSSVSSVESSSGRRTVALKKRLLTLLISTEKRQPSASAVAEPKPVMERIMRSES